MEILERTTQPKVPLRLQPKLPPMPLTRSRGKNCWHDAPEGRPAHPGDGGPCRFPEDDGLGTPGRAVDVGCGADAAGITDELYWNLLTAKAVVAEGQRQGLNMRFYDPGMRRSSTNRTPAPIGAWVEHASRGGYALEIHYDAYAPHGIGPGVIPAVA